MSPLWCPTLLVKLWCKKVNHQLWYIKKNMFVRACAYLTTWKVTALSYQHNSKSRGHHTRAQNFWLWSQYHKTLDVASRWLKHVDFGPSVNGSHHKLTIFELHPNFWWHILFLYLIMRGSWRIISDFEDNATKFVAVWRLKLPKTLI